MRTVKHVVALLFVVSILVPILPISCLAEGVAYAAGQVSSWHAAIMEWVLTAVEGSSRLQGGEWEYVLLEEGRYAVITGHSGREAQKLSAPAMLGGADVVGLAAGALADHAALESLALAGQPDGHRRRSHPQGRRRGGVQCVLRPGLGEEQPLCLLQLVAVGLHGWRGGLC